MQRTLNAIVVHSGLRLEALPHWYIPSDHMVCFQENFDVGTFATVHRGKWNGAEVVIKRLLTTGEQVETSFLREATVWFSLDHPHVLKMFGANHLSTPLFFVCEDATRNGNFVQFFNDQLSRRQLWRRFHEAALGLLYLHSQRVIHGNLKCNNLLIGADNKTKICDFGFSFIQSESRLVTDSLLVDNLRWTALECLEGVNPSFASDVYSLGMCIIEAVSGELPWNGLSDDNIWDELYGGEGHGRPDGFTDKEWELVESMIQIDVQDRIGLNMATELLQELANEEAASRFISEDSITKRLQDFVLGLTDLKEDERENLFDDIQKLEMALENEATAKQLWDELVRIGCMCDVCGEVNPYDSQFCCDCSSSIGSLWSAEKGWHKVAVKVPVDVEDAVSSLKDFASQQECSSCGTPASSQARFCTECGEQIMRIPQANPIAAAELREEMDKVMQLLESNDHNSVISEKRDKSCSSCGAMNLREEVFCCDCGNDIEIIKRNKL